MYTGNEVNEIIAIILEEADNAIVESYNEGYKQATLEYKPKLLQAENNINLLKSSLEQKDNNRITNYITSFGIGFFSGAIIGGVTGFNIAIKL